MKLSVFKPFVFIGILIVLVSLACSSGTPQATEAPAQPQATEAGSGGDRSATGDGSTATRERRDQQSTGIKKGGRADRVARHVPRS